MIIRLKLDLLLYTVFNSPFLGFDLACVAKRRSARLERTRYAVRIPAEDIREGEALLYSRNMIFSSLFGLC